MASISDAASEASEGEHRGWQISRKGNGYWFQHPSFDPENPIDWRYGDAISVQHACDEIDALLAEDAEWTAAAAIVLELQERLA